jgi:hypothetical protein
MGVNIVDNPKPAGTVKAEANITPTNIIIIIISIIESKDLKKWKKNSLPESQTENSSFLV